MITNITFSGPTNNLMTFANKTAVQTQKANSKQTIIQSSQDEEAELADTSNTSISKSSETTNIAATKEPAIQQAAQTKLSAATPISNAYDTSIMTTFTVGKKSKAETIRLTLREMKALREIIGSNSSKKFGSGPEGAAALVSALAAQGITDVTIAADGYSLQFSGGRILLGAKKASKSSKIRKIVTSDEFQSALSKATRAEAAAAA